jgi:hypothetical protein
VKLRWAASFDFAQDRMTAHFYWIVFGLPESCVGGRGYAAMAAVV